MDYGQEFTDAEPAFLPPPEPLAYPCSVLPVCTVSIVLSWSVNLYQVVDSNIRIECMEHKVITFHGLCRSLPIDSPAGFFPGAGPIAIKIPNPIQDARGILFTICMTDLPVTYGHIPRNENATKQPICKDDVADRFFAKQPIRFSPNSRITFRQTAEKP